MLAIAGTVTKRPDKVASQAIVCPALSLSCAKLTVVCTLFSALEILLNYLPSGRGGVLCS